MSRIKAELLETRKSLHAEAQRILDRAKGEKRELTKLEDTKFEGLTTDIRRLDETLDRIGSDEASAASAQAAMRGLMGGRPSAFAQGDDRDLNDRFRNSIRTRSFEPIEVHVPSDELRSGYQPGIEQRALATTSGSGMVGTSFFNRLTRHLVESSSILAAGATVLQSDSGEPIKVPKSTPPAKLRR